jgi:hypothetical protein
VWWCRSCLLRVHVVVGNFFSVVVVAAGLGLASVQRASWCWCGAVALAGAACPGGSSIPHRRLTSLCALRTTHQLRTSTHLFIGRAAASACLPSSYCLSVSRLHARSMTLGHLALYRHGRFRARSQQSACICQSRPNLRLHAPFARALDRNGPISSNQSCQSGGVLARDANQAVAVAASCATERSKPRAPQQKRVETLHS